jgi:hypothetical protein
MSRPFEVPQEDFCHDCGDIINADEMREDPRGNPVCLECWMRKYLAAEARMEGER